MEHLNDTIKKFTEIANAQEEKGIKKYGKPLNPFDDLDWLKMAEEEQVDGYKYLHAEKVKRDLIVEIIRQEIIDVPEDKRDRINGLLDRLVGS